MTMPRTPEQLRQAAEDAERWLDSLDPAAIAAPEADASDLRRIGEAVVATARNEAELAEAVAEARRNGRSWGQIATILGVSRQSARERFGDVIPTQR
jgi:FAD/FMN-containing dehydrogenase